VGIYETAENSLLRCTGDSRRDLARSCRAFLFLKGRKMSNITYSDDLRHFPKNDPVPKSGRMDARSKLQADIDDYLASGGQITEHGIEPGVNYPIRRTRAAQINFVRRRTWNRINNRK
jgi:hypothetical protein